MTLLVPFDGSELSVAALERARDLADARDEDVLAVTVLPADAEYARSRGWVDGDEHLDPDRVEERLGRQVADVAPGAAYRCAVVESDDPLASAEMDVARTVRQVAAEVDASVVVVGSENAGRVARPLTSVGSPVSEDPRYDVYIVRHAD
ncbi:MAG: universal stress protein [Halobacteriaceae archaeon]